MNEFSDSISKALYETSITRVNQYFPVSLEGEARQRRGSSGLRISVKEKAAIVNNWKKFLKEASNKTTLFYLIEVKMTANRHNGMTVVAQKEEGILLSTRIHEVQLVPCNHKETDTRMLLHVNVKYLSDAGQQKTSIKTVDTDVVTITLFH